MYQWEGGAAQHVAALLLSFSIFIVPELRAIWAYESFERCSGMCAADDNSRQHTIFMKNREPVDRDGLQGRLRIGQSPSS